MERAGIALHGDVQPEPVFDDRERPPGLEPGAGQVKRYVGPRHVRNHQHDLGRDAVGVMEDFNFESMKQKVTPLCLVLGEYNSSITSVKINGIDVKNVITYI